MKKANPILKKARVAKMDLRLLALLKHYACLLDDLESERLRFLKAFSTMLAKFIAAERILCEELREATWKVDIEPDELHVQVEFFIKAKDKFTAGDFSAQDKSRRTRLYETIHRYIQPELDRLAGHQVDVTVDIN